MYIVKRGMPVASILVLIMLCTLGLSAQRKTSDRLTADTRSNDQAGKAIQSCLIEAELSVTSTSLNSPLEGPFVPGEIVTFRFDILNYRADPTNSGNECQWLQGIVPVFGNGWAPVSFQSNGVPKSSSKPSDIWTWFEEGEVGYNSPTNEYTIYRDTVLDRLAICSELNPDCPGTGISQAESPMPGGWYITTKDSRAPCPQPGIDPDDSWGVPQECGSNQSHGSFTFSLTVRDFDDPVEGCQVTGFTDTWVEIYTFTDGEIGCFPGENSVCSQDSAYRFETRNICVPSNPTVRYFNQRDPLCNRTEINDFQLGMTSLPAYPKQRWPSCNNTDSLFRPHWITFIANSDQMEIAMDIEDCDNGQGVKWALYEIPCRSNIGREDLQVNPSQLGAPITDCENVQSPRIGRQNINFAASTGQLYGILIDGWEDDLCEISLEVISSGSLPDISGTIPDTPSFEKGEYGFEGDTICIGAEDVNFTVPAISGACRYRWRLYQNDSLVRTIEHHPSVTLDFPERNSYRLCVFASNFCENTPQSCLEFEVFPSKESVLIRDTVCEGESYEWRNEEGELIENLPPQNQPGLRQFSRILDNTEGCSITANLDLFVRSENEEAPTMVDTFACYTEFQQQPFVFFCDTLEGPGNYPFQQCISTVTGCDTFFNIQFEVLGGPVSIESQCDGEGNMIFAFNDPLDSGYTSWDRQFDIFENDPDLHAEIRWTTARGAIELDTSLQFSIAQEDIELYAENDTFQLTLNISIFNRGEALCSSELRYPFSIKDHFPFVNEIQGDKSFCLEEEDLQFWAVTSNPSAPMHDQPDDSIFLQLWDLPPGFFHIPPSNASADTILLGSPSISSGQQLCVEVLTDQCAFRDQLCTQLTRAEVDVDIIALDSCGQNIFTISGFEGGTIESYQWNVENGRIIGSDRSSLVIIEPGVQDSTKLSVEILSDCIGVGNYSLPPLALQNVIIHPGEEERNIYMRDCQRGSLLVITEEACIYRWGYRDTVTGDYQFPLRTADGMVWREAYLEIPDTVSPFREYFIERLTDCPPGSCESELIVLRESVREEPCGESMVSMFPNPNSGEFRLRYENYTQGTYSLQILNTLGHEVYQKVFSVENKDGEIPVRLPYPASGFYTILIIQNSEIVEQQTLIITK